MGGAIGRRPKRGTGVPPVVGDVGHAQDTPATTLQRRQGAYLPHWTLTAGGIYAVTFRLVDSLPAEVLERLTRERDELEREARNDPEGFVDDAQHRLAHLRSKRIEDFLDAGSGACWMKQARIAHMVAQSLQYFDHVRYHLHAWCVVPNHVHVLVEPVKGNHLSTILHGWKSFSAKQANRIIGRTGVFWQPEYYDHLIRDEGEYVRAVRYIEQNSVVAGLSPWPWVSQWCISGSSVS
ncbi:MAG: transposase [Planctomycetes bacterium]|nr:transposase [Planctomycetota bacterium]